MLEKTAPDGQKTKEFCLNTTFKTRGRDHKHSAVPWILECSACGTRCYPHTSYEFKSQAEEIAKELLDSIFIDNQTLSSLEKRFYFSESSLSQYSQAFRKYIREQIHYWESTLTGMVQGGLQKSNNIFSVIPSLDMPFQLHLGMLVRTGHQLQLLGQSSAELVWPFPEDKSGLIIVGTAFLATLKGEKSIGELDYSKMIVLDETFLTIGGIKYCLIIAVSREGELLSWTLGRHRKTEDLNKVFLKALERYPFPGVVVSDGFRGYQTMLKNYPFPIIHVAHIHQYPHNQVIISQRFYDHEKNTMVELQLGTTTDLFVTSGRKTLFYETKVEPLVKTKAKTKGKQKRGRPPGRKNRPKSVIEREKKEKQQKQQSGRPKKKRGPKAVFRSRKFFTATIDLEKQSLSLDNLSVTAPELYNHFFFLIYTLMILFKGQHLTSNYVENVFSQLKFVLNRGRRADVNKFLDDVQIFVIKNRDRIHNTKTLLEVRDHYLLDHPPPPGLAYRKFFRKAFVPYLM